MEQLDGILLLDKPQGITSAFAISRIKRLGQKKIGHGGTLDPMAKGLLIVLLGQATKLSGYLLEGGKKEYIGQLELGKTTDTWDKEGRVLETKSFSHVLPKDVENEVHYWLESESQIVPPYSAAKHNGKALYTLARAGKVVPVKTKNIQISQAEVLNLNIPFLDFRVECSSGSYIRSLAHSLGSRLECGAMLTALTRSFSHPFSLKQAYTLESVLDNPDGLYEKVLPLQAALPDWLCISCGSDIAGKIKNGMEIRHSPELVSCHLEVGARAFFQSEENTPLALMELVNRDSILCWKVLRGLWL